MSGRFLLNSYRMLLHLYPPAFRKRFASEMLELAGAAGVGEWPLIFGDTSLGIVRCWIEGSRSTAVVVEPGTYVPVGEFPVRLSGLVRGFALAFVITFGLWYLNYLYPPVCPFARSVVTPLVDAHSRQTVHTGARLAGMPAPSTPLKSNR